MYRRRTYRRKPKSVRRPYRRTRRTVGRKRYGKRLFRSKNLGFLSQDAVWVKLRFSEKIALSAADPNKAYAVYCGTNLYDPRYAIGGTQPTGFDQYMSFYDAWYCPGSKIDLTISNSNSGTAKIQLYPSTSPYTTAPSFDPDDQKYAVSAFVPGNGGDSLKRLRKYMSYSKLTGTGNHAADSTFWGTSTSAPMPDFYWNIAFGALNTLGTAGYLEVKITYYVKFFKRKTLDES